MTDDSTPIPTVGDDEIGSLEDRSGDPIAMALSHPPAFLNTFKRLRFLPIGGPEAAVCATTVCHHGVAEPSSNRCGITDFGSPACSTKLYHQGRESMSGGMVAKRSGNGRQEPSGKPSSSAPRRRHVGLIVRGEVYYLRLKVPQLLQSRVGH